MKYSTWNKDDKPTWNVKEAEADIHFIEQFARMAKFDGIMEKIMPQLIKDKTLCELGMAAAKEMYGIMSDKDNPSGYHLNHILSGKTVFSLFNNNGKVYQCECTTTDKDEAYRIAGQFDDAYVDDTLENGIATFYVQVLDKEGTEQMRDDECYGEFVADFDTYDEAEAEGASLDRFYILEMPSEEWWMVINNETNTSAYKMMFPTKTRALAFLYNAAKPKAWMDLVDYYAERDGE